MATRLAPAPAEVTALLDLLDVGSVASMGVVWGKERRPEVLVAVGLVAAGLGRVYLIGPPDLGGELHERAWLRRHAARLRARRGVLSAGDLLLLNRGGGRREVLLRGPAPGQRWGKLPAGRLDEAEAWFSVLFWRRSTQEGTASATGYRFHACNEADGEAGPAEICPLPGWLGGEQG